MPSSELLESSGRGFNVGKCYISRKSIVHVIIVGFVLLIAGAVVMAVSTGKTKKPLLKATKGESHEGFHLSVTGIALISGGILVEGIATVLCFIAMKAHRRNFLDTTTIINSSSYGIYCPPVPPVSEGFSCEQHHHFTNTVQDIDETNSKSPKSLNSKTIKTPNQKSNIPMAYSAPAQLTLSDRFKNDEKASTDNHVEENENCENSGFSDDHDLVPILK